jgi:hypothetical protein
LGWRCWQCRNLRWAVECELQSRELSAARLPVDAQEALHAKRDLRSTAGCLAAAYRIESIRERVGRRKSGRAVWREASLDDLDDRL